MFNVKSLRKIVLSAQSPKEKASAIMIFSVVTIKNLKCVVPNSSEHSGHLQLTEILFALFTITKDLINLQS